MSLPFAGEWLTVRSPATRIPSHGTHRWGQTYAFDFVAVDASGRSAAHGWRALFGTEPPERFVGFGQPIVAPLAGTVVVAHDGEPDHEARRSQLALIPYALTQGRRARAGAAGLAGNHVVLGCDAGFVLLAHLQRSSVEVTVGDEVVVGQRLGLCGNSGNSTEPHLHLHAMDTLDLDRARGLPIEFTRHSVDGVPVERGVPKVGQRVRPGA